MTDWNLKELKWLFWDFDGCLAPTKSIDDYSLEDLKPNPDVTRLARQAVKNGKKIIIYTARHWDDYPIIEKWLNKYKIPYKMIICGKPLGQAYIDDRAINPFCKECLHRNQDLWKEETD